MANKNNIISATKDKPNTKPVCCLNCLHAALHRYGSNPILSACHPTWKEDKNQKDVEQRRVTA